MEGQASISCGKLEMTVSISSQTYHPIDQEVVAGVHLLRHDKISDEKSRIRAHCGSNVLHDIDARLFVEIVQDAAEQVDMGICACQ